MSIQSDADYILALASMTKEVVANDLKEKKKELHEDTNFINESEHVYGLYQQIDSFSREFDNVKSLVASYEDKTPFPDDYNLLLVGYLKLVESIFNTLLMKRDGVSLSLVSSVFSMTPDIHRVSKEVLEQRYLSAEISKVLIPDLMRFRIAFDNSNLSAVTHHVQADVNKKIELERDAFNYEIKKELNKVSEAYSEGRAEIINTFKKYDRDVSELVDSANNSLLDYKNRFEIIGRDIDHKRDLVDELLSHATTQLDIVDGILKRTSQVGMAGAFQERHRALFIPMICWIVLFFVCLACLTWIGKMFVEFAFSSEVVVKTSTAEVISRLAITLPLIWGAWFSAKQYTHINQLREDYAYKVAIAMTYHGYKDEANNIHSDMSEKLLDSIVTQFSDNPVRLYKGDNANSILEAAVKSNKMSEIISVIKGGK